ncbi:hypothetical protein [Sandaracinobacteroides saxicola]|uniref:Uncharacterized protein n=1 Tax=Sandaracinobacteroides saxicola TaxID=2759707 RepID=A0A7G5IGM8_9SPHN|nr:hypothetical protein [Sandaracinobacteroides saxicola]QMW22520.1 hypothetical protein H3309_14470 [Sandaracinobacteroides saxicola]
MARSQSAQINIRSAFVRDRVSSLVRRTGMTATQIVEEALRAYVPPVVEPAHGRLVRKGLLLVMTDGRRVSRAETDAAILAARLGERGD